MPEYARSDKKILSQLYRKNELSYKVSFLDVVTRNKSNTFNNFKWKWSDVSKRILILHIGRLQQKQAITVKIYKILVRE